MIKISAVSKCPFQKSYKLNYTSISPSNLKEEGANRPTKNLIIINASQELAFYVDSKYIEFISIIIIHQKIRT